MAYTMSIYVTYGGYLWHLRVTDDGCDSSFLYFRKRPNSGPL